MFQNFLSGYYSYFIPNSEQSRSQAIYLKSCLLSALHTVGKKWKLIGSAKRLNLWQSSASMVFQRKKVYEIWSQRLYQDNDLPSKLVETDEGEMRCPVCPLLLVRPISQPSRWLPEWLPIVLLIYRTNQWLGWLIGLYFWTRTPRSVVLARSN